MSYRSKILGANIAGLLLFSVDRWLKLLSPGHSDLNFGRKFFSFYANHGLAFGLPFSRFLMNSLFILIFTVLIWLLVRYYREKNIFLIAAITLIILGAASNFLDRLHYGYVVDYLDVPFFTVFNIADAMIVLGIGMLIMKIWKSNST